LGILCDLKEEEYIAGFLVNGNLRNMGEEFEDMKTHLDRRDYRS
jgi:hypothetical protein